MVVLDRGADRHRRFGWRLYLNGLAQSGERAIDILDQRREVIDVDIVVRDMCGDDIRSQRYEHLGDVGIFDIHSSVLYF